MVQYQLDRSFAALADATRRGILDELGRAPASISSLAERFTMTLTGMKKHISVLEEAGLVRTAKVGRTRLCTLGDARLDAEAAFIERYRRLQEERLDHLEALLESLPDEAEPSPGPGAPLPQPATDTERK